MISFRNDPLKELKQAEKELNRKIEKIKNATQAGLLAGAVKIKEKALKQTPRDLGNLRNSAYVVWPRGKQSQSGGGFKERIGKTTKETVDVKRLQSEHEVVLTEAKSRVTSPSKIMVEIGYSAYYALYVHEIDFSPNYTTENTNYKYLQLAIQENMSDIINIIKKRAEKEFKK